MSLFGFIGEVASATIKIAATPLAAASDVISIAIGGDADATKNLIKSAGDDLSNAEEEIFP